MTGAGADQQAEINGAGAAAVGAAAAALDARDVYPKDHVEGNNGRSGGTPFTDDRTAFVYSVLVGYNVVVKAKDGIVYEGVFSAADGKKLVLRMGRLVENPAEGSSWTAGRPQEVVVIPQDCWLELICRDVRMGAADVGPVGVQDDAGGFGTDAAISRGRGGREGRELQRWAPDTADAAALEQMESLPQRPGGGGASWDQFALNERKFGVRTDYREELYTTALDPSKSTISRAEANRIAAEIERDAGRKGASANRHVMEERGIEVDDGEMDEEDRYGAVIREPAQSATAPPPRGSNGPAGAWGRGKPAALPAPTPAINIDSRRETNKLRAQMTPSGKKSSPYGTPKSPLISDPHRMEALNLDPGVPRFDQSTRSEFAAFKQQQQGRSAGSSPGGTALSEMRQLSEAVGSKLQKTASGEREKEKAAAQQQQQQQQAVEGAVAADKTQAEPAPAAKPSSTLNPNAKTFSFNPAAKEFKFPAPSAAPSAAAPPPAAAAPRPFGGGGLAAGPGPRQQQQPGGYEGRGPLRGPPEMEGHDGGHGGYGRRRDDREERYTDRERDRRGGGDRERDRRHHDSSRPPPPPPGEGGSLVHPPPPPPGKAPGGGGPQGLPMGPGMMPPMMPMMMMPGGMPGGGQPYFMMPGARPGQPVFVPPGGPMGGYMQGRPGQPVPMMMPMGMPMPPNMVGMGYQQMPPGAMHPYGGPGGHRGGPGGYDAHRSSPHRGSPHRGSPMRDS